MASGNDTLSQRGAVYATPPNPMGNYRELPYDTYDPETNPTGFINIGTSDNHAMSSEVSAHLDTNPLKLRPSEFMYGEGPAGSLRLRKAMAQYMNKYFKPYKAVNQDDLYFANGCGSVCEALGYTIFDEHDALLISQPSYVGFPHDFGAKSKVNLYHVPFHGTDQFSPSCIGKFEAALNSATTSSIKVRAVMLCNPHNPSGRCYPIDTIIALMRFCNKHRLHLISDEIYATSVYSPGPRFEPHTPFTSVLSIDYAQHIDPNLLHVMYGLSKDFAASGIRIGCLLVRNRALMDALLAVSQSHWPGIADQMIGVAMLEDGEWLERFRKLNAQTLAERSALLRKSLDEKGIPYDGRANAGFFLWVDMRKWLPKTDEKGQSVQGWESERVLVRLLKAKKVILTAGEDQAAEEPGFFRVVFSHREQVLEQGLQRVFKVLDEISSEQV
ncbi:putative inactive 1-aminocyclopropane-1-carboxylate synthase-like protein 2 [Lasiodiplodia hormozganensis]|uniref:Inactive 1-aminocyclopropane-1-carboxylate synthase-like protein 2 n=1 Tax=Lasiodiplodia hormozganensis TaxID=869390 RepID=A0AA39Z6J5_9PEZI|nr:putative inactive 1-aminocyclopropane-1-carboxylate synthase-like protein 2 [Lasiodiplodia hormozganensis]